MSDDNQQFVQRVTSLPVVASTLDQLWTIYSRCKESNQLVRFSLEKAETGARLLTDSAVPMVQKLPINGVNALACSQLSRLEQQYPIIAKPTDQVLDETRKFLDARVRPLTDARDLGLGKVRAVTDQARAVGEYTQQTAYHTIAVATDYAKDRLDNALDYAESYVDKYIPADQNDADAKPRQRVYRRAMRELRNLQKRSKETLDQLNFTVSLIDYARTNMDYINTQVSSTVHAMQDKPLQWWEEINKEENGNEEQTTGLEQQALRVARHLAQRLRKGLYAVNEADIPGHLADRLQAAKQYSTDLLRAFVKTTKVEDVTDTVLEQARSQLTYIQDTLTYVGDLAVSSWPLSQVLPEWKVEQLNDSETSETSSEADE